MNKTTDRIRVRDVKSTDLESFYRILSDEKVMYYLPDLYVTNEMDARENLINSINSITNIPRMKYHFVIETKDTNEYIGQIGLEILKTNGKESIADLGYFILTEYQGKGYVTEAAGLIIDFAFNETNIFKIETGCLKENCKSEAVMQRLGMNKEAEFINHEFHNGEWKTRVYYGLLKDDVK